MRNVKASVAGAEPRPVAAFSTVADVVPERTPDGQPVLAALLNNEVVSLAHPIGFDCRLVPLTLASTHGWRVYRWSLMFLLGKAFRETFSQAAIRVRHPIGGGLFYSVDWHGADRGDPAAAIRAVETRMRDIVGQDLAVDCFLLSYEAAIDRLMQSGQNDQLHLLKYRNPPQVLLTRCGDFIDMRHEPLVHRTGLLAHFALTPYESGFVLRLPSQNHPQQVAPLNPNPHLVRIYQEHIAWGRILGITTVGELNAAIDDRRADDVIGTVEALHDKKLARIADEIAGHAPSIRLVLIAGPSSAGKTTFAKRLMMHLRVNGIRPFLLSTDDYFVGDARNPRDADGHLDYEHIQALDLPRLNRDLGALLAGKPVCLPRFDFKRRASLETAVATTLAPDQTILIEGIHALNPALTEQVPDAVKFRIYISALTQLAIDDNSRISTTDNRLLRRMVRDNQFRQHTALETLRRWPSVLRGEERWIFPYQHHADTMFNSSLDYELAVLKPFAAALLNEVKPTDPEYAEARRLSGFLHNFVAIPPLSVPGDSILREYIGGSQLHY